METWSQLTWEGEEDEPVGVWWHSMVNWLYLDGKLKCLSGVGEWGLQKKLKIKSRNKEPWDEFLQLCIHALLIGPGSWDVLLQVVNLFVIRPCGCEERCELRIARVSGIASSMDVCLSFICGPRVVSFPGFIVPPFSSLIIPQSLHQYNRSSWLMNDKLFRPVLLFAWVPLPTIPSHYTCGFHLCAKFQSLHAPHNTRIK